MTRTTTRNPRGIDPRGTTRCATDGCTRSRRNATLIAEGRAHLDRWFCYQCTMYRSRTGASYREDPAVAALAATYHPFVLADLTAERVAAVVAEFPTSPTSVAAAEAVLDSTTATVSEREAAEYLLFAAVSDSAVRYEVLRRAAVLAHRDLAGAVAS